MKTLGELVDGRKVHFVNAGYSVQQAAEYMAFNNVGAVPVLDGDKLAGIFSERDLMVRCVAKDMDLKATSIEDVMTKKVILMESTDNYEDCLALMRQENIRHVPVRDGDKLIGVISIRDLLQLEAEEKEQKIDILHSYIHYNPKG
jgi:CBS domain-containing protein